MIFRGGNGLLMRRRKDAADEAHDSSQSLDTSEDEVAYVEGYLLEMTVTGPKVCERIYHHHGGWLCLRRTPVAQ